MNEIINMLQANRPLGSSILIFSGISLVLLFLMPFESREVLGINLWIKPLKFALSITVFLLTSYYLLELLPLPSGRKSIYSWVLIITMFIEIVAIIIQAGRGQLSHFNTTDPLGTVLFPLMGFAITLAYIVYTCLLIEFFIHPISINATLLWSIRIGIFIFLFGAITGFQMAGSLQHSIGVSDGGPGIPFTNWSTVAGDLRVAHFFSIHAIQVLPFVALVLMRYTKFEERTSLTLVILSGVLYFAFNFLTYIQALYGKPFIRM